MVGDKVIVTASCGIEVAKVIAYKPLLDAAIDMSASKPEKCVIFQRPMETAAMIDGRDVDWVDAMSAATPADCVPVAATDPLYILYTSGTTGFSKGVMIRRKSLLSNIVYARENMKLKSGDTICSFLQMDHI